MLSATETACERSALTLADETTKFENKPSSSVFSHASAKSTPLYRGLVYWRRKHYNPVVLFPSETFENVLPKSPFSGACPSIGSGSSLAMEKCKDDMALNETEGVRSSMSTVICSDEQVSAHSGANDQCLAKQHDSNDKVKVAKEEVELYTVDDSCSSSMIIIDTGSASLKTEVDENGECSSSSAFVGELMGDYESGKDFCISILKSHKLLSCLLPNKSCTSEDEIASCSRSVNSCSCSVCGILGTTETMLICDQCEEAVHVSCCSTTARKILFDEWFCQCCLKKRHKIMEKTTRGRSKVIQSELSCIPAASKAKTSSIAAMLNASEPYTTGVRIGKDFQALVPCWSGPITKNIDDYQEPVELDPVEIKTCHELSSEKLHKRKPIGNWIQCRGVIVGLGKSDGTICGKWRRAPLFEVQTDKWDCFSSVHWDPTHADCAVPQEVETAVVMRQLKYIELLKPRLEAKKRKLEAVDDY